MIKDIYPGTTSSSPYRLKVLDSKLYFAANDGKSGVEPWVSDGTAAGTFRLMDIK
jgi:ELWxxDGT repeat protein